MNIPPSYWKDVSVVVVTYNSAAVIAACLKSVAMACQVIIVDNASTDSTCEIAARVLPSVRIIRNDHNIGFGAAVNQGMAAVKTPFGFCFSPDAVLTERAMEHLCHAAARYTETAMFGPYLRNEAGEQELYVMGPGDNQHMALGRTPSGDFSSWFVMGGFFLCRMTAWRDIGGFDERIFLYNEDADLCLRLNQAGHHLAVIPGAVVIHAGGQSSKVTWRVKWLKDWHQTWSHLYMTAKHGDPAAAKAKAWKILKKQGLKAVLYALLLHVDRVRGNLAKASAAAAFLRGRGSR